MHRPRFIDSVVTLTILIASSLGAGFFPVPRFFFVQAAQGTRSAVSFGVYTYDSLVAEGGLGEVLFPGFQKAHPGCLAKPLPVGDAGQMVSRIQLDSRRGKFDAQVALGVDQHLWQQLKPLAETWSGWEPEGLDRVAAPLLISGKAGGFLPFDYGVFAFILNRAKLGGRSVPRSLRDLLKPEWRRSLILQDPRTSTPGLAFLLYTEAVLQEHVWKHWQDLRTQWLTLAPGWDGAYSLFLRGQAPLVWSYTSSQAYHRIHDPSDGSRYEAILFEEGNPAQVEGAFLIRDSFSSTAQRECARKFLSFLISEPIQKEIPTRNWMLPVRRGVRLPSEFESLPTPPANKLLLTDGRRDIQRSLRRWLEALYEVGGPVE